MILLSAVYYVWLAIEKFLVIFLQLFDVTSWCFDLWLEENFL